MLLLLVTTLLSLVTGGVDTSTGELLDPKVRLKETLNAEFWEPIFEFTDFKEFVTKQYKIGLPTQIDPDKIVEQDD
jgi:hypothetical protein